MPYPSMRLITPHTPKPAPKAMTRTFSVPIAEVKKAIIFQETKIADFVYYTVFDGTKK